MTNVMRPRVIVDYEREPWVYDTGTVRLTFDSNVRAAKLRSFLKYQNMYYVMKKHVIYMILSIGMIQIINRNWREG